VQGALLYRCVFTNSACRVRCCIGVCLRTARAGCVVVSVCVYEQCVQDALLYYAYIHVVVFILFVIMVGVVYIFTCIFYRGNIVYYYITEYFSSISSSFALQVSMFDASVEAAVSVLDLTRVRN